MHQRNHTTPRPSRRAARRAPFLLSTVLLAGLLASTVGTARAERSYLAWAQAFANEPGVTQNGVATAMDRRGNVAVTGYVFINNKENYYTIKYDGLTGAPDLGRAVHPRLWETPPFIHRVRQRGQRHRHRPAEGNGTGFDYYTINTTARPAPSCGRCPIAIPPAPTKPSRSSSTISTT